MGVVKVVMPDINHEMPIAEFRDRVISEIGSVAITMTKGQFEKQAIVAFDRVLQSIHDEKVVR